jgi:predicted outer membrane repeat protein
MPPPFAGALLLGLFTLSRCGEAGAAIWRVRADGSGDRPTLQAALDEVASGDSLLLGPGTYPGPFLTVGKSFTLIGEEGAAATFLDGSASPGVRVLTLVESGHAVVLQGLTVRNGYAGGADFPGVDGGGIGAFCTPLVLMDCVFTECWALIRGGAVYCAVNYIPGVCDPAINPPFPGLVVVDCRFQDNKAFGEGGAIYADDTYTSIESCTFEGNYAVQGAAVEILNLSLWMKGCVLERNTADFFGGALRASGTMLVSIEESRFQANTCGYRGGAVEVRNAGLVSLVSCAFIGNEAADGHGDGGALYLASTDLEARRVLWRDSSARNQGGAVFLNQVESALFASNTWTGNRALRGASVGYEDCLAPGGCSSEFMNCLVLDEAVRAVDCRLEETAAACNGGGLTTGACFPFDARVQVEACDEDPGALCTLVTAACGALGHADRLCAPGSCATPVRRTTWGLLKSRSR